MICVMQHCILWLFPIAAGQLSAIIYKWRHCVNPLGFTSRPSWEKSNLDTICSDKPKYTTAIVFLSTGKQTSTTMLLFFSHRTAKTSQTFSKSQHLGILTCWYWGFAPNCNAFTRPPWPDRQERSRTALIGTEQKRRLLATWGTCALPLPSSHTNVFHGVEDHWVGKRQLQRQHQTQQTHGILAGTLRLILSALISWLSSLQCETLPGRVLGQQRGGCIFWRVPKVTGTNWGDKGPLCHQPRPPSLWQLGLASPPRVEKKPSLSMPTGKLVRSSVKWVIVMINNPGDL